MRDFLLELQLFQNIDVNNMFDELLAPPNL